MSFAYGVFHAAGPGHGKAVISSYVVANGETWRRGVVLSFASAILQALVAVAIVGIAAVLLGATRRTMDGTICWIEVFSYGLIARARRAAALGQGPRVHQCMAEISREPGAGAQPCMRMLMRMLMATPVTRTRITLMRMITLTRMITTTPIMITPP